MKRKVQQVWAVVAWVEWVEWITRMLPRCNSVKIKYQRVYQKATFCSDDLVTNS